MVYIYFSAAYYHLNLDVTKENLLATGFSAGPAVFLVINSVPYIQRIQQGNVLVILDSITYL